MFNFFLLTGWSIRTAKAQHQNPTCQPTAKADHRNQTCQPTASRQQRTGWKLACLVFSWNLFKTCLFFNWKC